MIYFINSPPLLHGLLIFTRQVKYCYDSYQEAPCVISPLRKFWGKIIKEKEKGYFFTPAKVELVNVLTIGDVSLTI